MILWYYLLIFGEGGVVCFNALCHNRQSLFSAHYFAHGRVLVFQRLINLEEVLHFLEYVAGQLLDFGVAVVRGLLKGYCDNFGVLFALVRHIYNADGVALYNRGWQNGFAAKHQNVQRVAVVGKRARNKAVARGVNGGGVKHPVKPQYARRLVKFVFRARTFGYLYVAHKVVFFNSFGGNVVPDVHK